MSIFALMLLAFAMSTDAFAAAIGKGVKIKNPRFSFAIKVGFTFGLIEAITPVIGWIIGHASSYVEAWDHWIALIILTGLGVYMVFESFQPAIDDESKTQKQSFILLCVTAFGTSIDAMAVGASLAFVDVNIMTASGLIGLATFLMVTTGIMLGSLMGSLIGKRAETFGGVILISVGMWIFTTHTL